VGRCINGWEKIDVDVLGFMAKVENYTIRFDFRGNFEIYILE